VIINLEDISIYSKCPQYYHFHDQNRPMLWHPTTQIVTDTIKKAYLTASDTGYRADWRRITGWVDKMAFSGVDVQNEEEFKSARSISEAALLALSGWYENLYRFDEPYAQIDVAVGCNVDSGEVGIRADIPVVKLEEIPVIMRFCDFVPSKPKIYNDIVSRGLAAMLADAVQCDTVKVQHFAVGTRGRLEYEEIQVNRDAHERSLAAIAKIAILIKTGMVYPSVTEMCTTCKYKKECVL